MKRTIKPNYAPPMSEVMEVKFQGVLCQSGNVKGNVNGNVNATMPGPFNEIDI